MKCYYILKNWAHYICERKGVSMKLFENKIGRPSNEIKKKRGIVYALLSLVLVIMLMMTSFMLNSAFSMEKVSGSMNFNGFFKKITQIIQKIVPQIPGLTKSLVTIKIEDTSNDTTKDKDGVYLVTKSGNYKPVVTIKQKTDAKLYYKWFIYADLDAKNLSWKDSGCRVTSGEKEYVDNNVEPILINESNDFSKRSGKLKVYYSKEDCDADENGSSKAIKSSIINYKYSPKKKNIVTITLTDKSGLKSKDNIVYVNDTGDYSVIAKVTQSENANLYYRWDTYTGANANTHSYTDTLSHGNYAYCSSFKEKEITFNSLERLEYNDKNTPRSGKFSLYKNETDCKNGKNSVKSAVIGYQIGSPSTTTKNGITIKLEDKGGKSKNSNNIVTVSSTGSYYVKATITKNDNKTLYYRWDTFNGLDAKTWTYSSSDDRCIAFSSKSISLNNLESLDFYDENNPRSGRLSVYDNKSTCDKDSKNTGKSALASAVISYAYSYESTNDASYKTVKYDFKQIKTKFGKQAPSECYKAAMTYAAWIAQGIDRSDIMRHSTDYSRSEWGSNSYRSGGSTKDVYALIIDRINAGKPVVIHGSCKDDYYWSHWVTVVGYKTGITANNANASDFLVIDPIEPKEKTLYDALPGGLGGDAGFERIWW